jgi:uncharacterized membrane protein YgcG
VFLTDFIVALLALLGQTAEQTAVARIIGTVIGGALALLAYLAWPTWAGGSAQQKLAQLFDREGRYVSLLLRAYVRPGQTDTTVIRTASTAARRARADAEAYADRLADEPPRPPMTAKLAYALTGTARRIAHAALTMQAAVDAPGRKAGGEPPAGQQPEALVRAAAGAPAGLTPPDAALSDTGGDASGVDTGGGEAGGFGTGGGDAGSLGAGGGDAGGGDPVVALVDRFADGVEASAQAIEGSLLALQPPAGLPPLREIQAAIEHELSESGAGAQRRARLAGPGSVLVSTTDEFADAFDSAADILRRNLGGE